MKRSVYLNQALKAAFGTFEYVRVNDGTIAHRAKGFKDASAFFDSFIAAEHNTRFQCEIIDYTNNRITGAFTVDLSKDGAAQITDWTPSLDGRFRYLDQKYKVERDSEKRLVTSHRESLAPYTYGTRGALWTNEPVIEHKAELVAQDVTKGANVLSVTVVEGVMSNDILSDAFAEYDANVLATKSADERLNDAMAKDLAAAQERVSLAKLKINRKPQTNVEFVTELMNYGNPLKQAVIIEAIAKMCAAWSEMDADAQKGGTWDFISPHAWKACAQEIDAAIKARGY